MRARSSCACAARVGSRAPSAARRRRPAGGQTRQSRPRPLHQIGSSAGKARDEERCGIINALRAHLAELGIVAAQGDVGVNALRAIVADERDERLPIDARASVMVLAASL